MERATKSREAGFTLIELLVVIVILGILAGIVVFAVRGAGDKGQREATVTEARIIRTAQEVYCARRGEYAPDFETLEQSRLLSGDPGYHTMTFHPTNGPCGGTNYTLDPSDPREEVPVPPPPPTDPVGLWTPTDGPAGPPQYLSTSESMVQLLTGKVLAVEQADEETPGSLVTELYDPAADTQPWADGPTVLGAGSWLNDMVLINGSLDECGANCGKVLAHIGGHPGHWELYDPLVPPTGAWTPTPPAAFTRNHYAKAVQIRGTREQCGTNCGRILIVGQGGEGLNDRPPTPSVAELYDPKANAFVIGQDYGIVASDLAALPDGRVLVVGSNAAKVFDPLSGLFNDAEAPPSLVSQAVTLSNGSVLAVGKKTALVYRPNSGMGTWTKVPTCGDNCHLLAALSDGKVLANASDDGYRLQGNHPNTFLFDPSGSQWIPTNPPSDQDAIGVGVFLSGECTPNCGKVLAAGRGKAELFSLNS